MENWGSWTFSDENKHLLAEVLDKFASDKCSLDAQRKFVLSSLAVLPQVGSTQVASVELLLHKHFTCMEIDSYDFRAWKCFFFTSVLYQRDR